jgi:hypothetical protein
VIARFGGLAPRSCGRRETIGSPAVNLPYFLNGTGRHFMRDYCISYRECVRDQIIIGNLQKCVDRANLVSLAGDPLANGRERLAYTRIWLEKKLIAVLIGPFHGIVVDQFRPHLLDAEYGSLLV